MVGPFFPKNGVQFLCKVNCQFPKISIFLRSLNHRLQRIGGFATQWIQASSLHVEAR